MPLSPDAADASTGADEGASATAEDAPPAAACDATALAPDPSAANGDVTQGEPVTEEATFGLVDTTDVADGGGDPGGCVAGSPVGS